jgi:5-methyltetrahydropteroyltriglutamate--homocysteine methyltransferase
MPEIWRISPDKLAEAQDEATRLAVRDMLEAGIDIVTDGEMRRESYSNRFATALDGVDLDNPATVINRVGGRSLVPRIVGPIRRRAPVEVSDVLFLRHLTDRPIKITLPGPFTMAQQVQDEYYGDDEALALAYAVAVNEEVRDLKSAGADVVQIDEPWLEARPEAARRYGVTAIDRALEGIEGTTVVHVCFGYAAAVKDKPGSYRFLAELADSRATQISIEAAQPKLDLGVLRDLGDKDVMLGVIDLGATEVESAEMVASRIRGALDHIAAERLVVAPDCGMKYLPRGVALAKLRALTAGTMLIRDELR